MDRKELIRRGNVIITEYREAVEAGCYLGNGRFGAVFGSLGLNMSPVMQEKYAEKGQSQFMHMDHWGRFRFHSDAMDKETSADYILPLTKLHWEQEPGQVCRYSQCQEFYDGTLETDFGLESGEQVRTGFYPLSVFVQRKHASKYRSKCGNEPQRKPGLYQHHL